jgi:hypothetical protein
MTIGGGVRCSCGSWSGAPVNSIRRDLLDLSCIDAENRNSAALSSRRGCAIFLLASTAEASVLHIL